MLVFLLQKRRMLQFDEYDEEGMTYLLVATATHPTTTTEQSLVAEEARVEPSERMESGTRGLRPLLRLPKRLLMRILKGWTGSWRCQWNPLIPLSYSLMRRLRPRRPTDLESLHRLETVGVTEDPPAADGAMVVGCVGSSGTTAQS